MAGPFRCAGWLYLCFLWTLASPGQQGAIPASGAVLQVLTVVEAEQLQDWTHSLPSLGFGHLPRYTSGVGLLVFPATNTG